MDSLPEAVEGRYFSWATAILGRYDVFHIHWPEYLLRGSSLSKRIAKKFLFTALLLRLHLSKVPVIKTVHNLQPHENEGLVDGILLKALDNAVRGTVRLNDATPTREGVPSIVIPHGDYHRVVEKYPRSSIRPGNILTFGLIRKYKGVENLVEAFRKIPSRNLSLKIMGEVRDASLASDLHNWATNDSRIELALRFATEAELVDAVSQASLVVLPYRVFHNSGAAIYALSLDRPILVPSNPVTQALRDEVGKGWVHLFEDCITAQDITDALGALGERVASRPDLQNRDWHRSSELLHGFYSQVLSNMREKK